MYPKPPATPVSFEIVYASTITPTDNTQATSISYLGERTRSAAFGEEKVHPRVR